MHVLYFVPENIGAPDFLAEEIGGLLKSDAQLKGWHATNAAAFGCEKLGDLVDHLRGYKDEYDAIIVGVQGGRVLPKQYANFVREMSWLFPGKIGAYLNEAQKGDNAALLKAGFSFVVDNEADDETLSLQLKVAAQGKVQGRYVQYGPLVLDSISGLIASEKKIRLRPSGRTILGLLIENAGVPVSREKIYAHVYSMKPEAEKPEIKTIDVHTSYLRKELNRVYPDLFGRRSQWKPDGELLQKIWGWGYILNPFRESAAKAFLPGQDASDDAVSIGQPPELECLPADQAEPVSIETVGVHSENFLSVTDLVERIKAAESTADNTRAVLFDRLGEDWPRDAQRTGIAFQALCESGLEKGLCLKIVPEALQLNFARFLKDDIACQAELGKAFNDVGDANFTGDIEQLFARLKAELAVRDEEIADPWTEWREAQAEATHYIDNEYLTWNQHNQPDAKFSMVDPVPELLAWNEAAQPSENIADAPGEGDDQVAQIIRNAKSVAETVNKLAMVFCRLLRSSSAAITPAKLQRLHKAFDAELGSEWRQGGDDLRQWPAARCHALQAIFYGSGLYDTAHVSNRASLLLHYYNPMTILGISHQTAYRAIQGLHEANENICLKIHRGEIPRSGSDVDRLTAAKVRYLRREGLKL